MTSFYTKSVKYKYLKQATSFLLLVVLSCEMESCTTTKEKLTTLNQQMNNMNHQLVQLEKKQKAVQSQKTQTLQDIESNLSTSINTNSTEKPNSENGVSQQSPPINGSQDIQSVSLDEVLKSDSSSSKTEPKNAVEVFREAYGNFEAGMYDKAVEGFQESYDLSNDDNVKSLALYWAGESRYKQSKWKESLPFYLKLESEYPQSPVLPSAYIKIGYLYLHLNNPEKGKQILNYLVLRYPESAEAQLAKTKLAELNSTP